MFDFCKICLWRITGTALANVDKKGTLALVGSAALGGPVWHLHIASLALDYRLENEYNLIFSFSQNFCHQCLWIMNLR